MLCHYLKTWTHQWVSFSQENSGRRVIPQTFTLVWWTVILHRLDFFTYVMWHSDKYNCEAFFLVLHTFRSFSLFFISRILIKDSLFTVFLFRKIGSLSCTSSLLCTWIIPGSYLFDPYEINVPEFLSVCLVYVHHWRQGMTTTAARW